ncbi:MAG TPA: hypothetical protein VGQ76_13645 [Thermoanaerobaculia bacterium]|jgi:tetratricopeptide (TPR) repeat protein|nr:hypothetical protein [Thermoanaerobaculia bacterium]
MPAKIPAIREIAWSSAIPQLTIMTLLIGGSLLVFEERSTALFVGAGTYLILSRGLKAVLARDHARGIRLLRAGRNDEAIAAFEKSYAFFSHHPWLDRWRYLTLLSSSAYSYRELALCNVAFANLQMDRVDQALGAYRRALVEFPACPMATHSIRVLEMARRDVAV